MIGEKIKLLRVEKGIKQEELALATSISVQVYAMFDSKRAPS